MTSASADATPGSQRVRRPFFWWIGASVLFLLASYGVGSGWPSRLHNADSLIPVFVSLDGWTLFYWGQDRFGMLLPLLAGPLRDSVWNLLAQNMAGVGLLLAGTAAGLARCGVRPFVAGAMFTLSLLLAWPADDVVLLVLTSNQSYGPALGLFGLGFALCRGSPRMAHALAATLMALGAWTNAGVALLVLAIAAIGCLMPTIRRASLSVAIGAGGGLVVHRVLQAFVSSTLLDRTHVSFVSVSEIPVRLGSFWTETYAEVLGPGLWGLLALAVVARMAVRNRPAARASLVAVFGGCAAYALAMVLLLGGVGRHAAPILPAIVVTLLAVSAPRLAWRPHWSAMAAVVLTTIVTLQTGMRSPASLRRQLVEDLAQGHAETLYVEGVTVITGDYWSAWPYAFALNVLHERVSGTRPVLAVALRAEDQIAHRGAAIGPGTVIAAVPVGDYRYWAVRGPKVELASKTVADDYEIAIVVSH